MNLGSESETVEFKKSTGEHKEALQAISAMLNKHGGGELYFGVKDNGNVVGQEVTDATIRQVAGWVSDKIEPPISPTIERLASDDSRAYVRVAFSGAGGMRWYSGKGGSGSTAPPQAAMTSSGVTASGSTSRAMRFAAVV